MCYLIAKEFDKQGCIAVKTMDVRSVKEITKDGISNRNVL